MDSFFSLFEPAEAPRRERGGGGGGGGGARRAAGRSAHAPEESSFLCEPQLSTDMLVKDVGYIDSFIDMKYEPGSAEPKKTDEQKKKKSTGRKSRRKKKPSPPKEFVPRQCWKQENLFYPECYNNEPAGKVDNWNNKRGGWRQRGADNLGKNVNDLQREGSAESERGARRCRRRAEPFNLERQADEDAVWPERAASVEPEIEPTVPYGVAERLEQASVRDELFLAGDADLRELEPDVFCSSDEDGDVGDSSSDLEEDSGCEVYGSLPPEPQLGNVEYKLQLVGPSEKRFQHLVTQLKWRLASGGGSAVYVVGVRDCGALRGLRARALRASLCTLRRMAAALRATVRRVSTRRVAPHRAVAEVYIRKLADTQRSVELRVAVMGANEAGKSTLIGVLTQGELDNGRGSARLNMFRHLHEVRSGRTSSLSHEILGFDAQGDVVNYGCSELMTAERIGERSAKLVSFLDLAGHSKYQRTTVHGLTGYSPHYAMLVVSATAGIGRMTEEHLGLLLALDLPFVVVVTRIELAPAELAPLLARTHDILRAAGCQKRPLLITNEQQARSCAAPAQSPILDKLNVAAYDTIDRPEEAVPVFPVSCVTGRGLNALHGYLLAAEPPADPLSHLQPDPEEEACEFQIDEIFRVGESGEPVVGGLLARGVLHEGDHLLIGPLDWGDFVPITVRTIYRNRVPCGAVRAGQSASLGLSRRPPSLRQGMVLLAAPPDYQPKLPEATDNGCGLKTSPMGVANDTVPNGRKSDSFSRNNSSLLDVEVSGCELRTSATDKVHGTVSNGKSNDEDDSLADSEDNVGAVDAEVKLKTLANNVNQNGMIANERRIDDDGLADSENNVSSVDAGVKLKNVANNRDLNGTKRKTWLCNNNNAISNNTDDDASVLDKNDDNTRLKTSDNSTNDLRRIYGDPNRNCVAKKRNPVTSEPIAPRGGLDVNDNAVSEGPDARHESAGSESDCAERERRRAERARRWDVKNFKRKEKNLLRDLARAESGRAESTAGAPKENLYRSDSDSEPPASPVAEEAAGESSGDEILLEDPNDPRGSFYFQASVRVLRHSTAIYPGFQATVHIGNIRQTAVIEGIMSSNSVLRAGESASVVFRFVRQPEYVRAGRKMLFRAGLETRGVGRLTQVFPCARRSPPTVA